MSAETGALSVEAPAKINLYLHVVGRRADGYHLLDGLVAFAGIGDTVAVAPAPELTLAIDGPFAAGLSAGADNLVLRAARELGAAAGVTPRAAIGLTKRLPVASGIGGGSADAAAALHALNRLWRLGLDRAALATIGERIGADVPMCVIGRSAFIGGIGEEIAPVPPLPPCWLVLANPGVALPTPVVFRGRRGPYSPPARFAGPIADAAALAAVLARRRNDLTDAAIAEVPQIAPMLAALAALPGALLARMSGSGATSFALFAAEAEARAAAAAPAARQPGWWVVAAPVAVGGTSG